MKNFIPKMYQKSIYNIDYKKLKKRKVKCLLFDLDNTCVSYFDKKSNNKLKKLMKELKELGFLVIIFSNSPLKRLNLFKDLNVEFNASSKKPFSKNFIKVLKKYNLKKDEVCIIGDQLFTDILGGNKVGILTCLVDPLTSKDFILTKITRNIEKLVFYRMKNKNILIKGVYYE